MQRQRQRFDGQAGHAVVDTRHLPIVVVRWFGVIDVELVSAVVQWNHALLDELEREQLRAVMVLDTSQSEPPDSDCRRALVSSRSAANAIIKARMVGEFIVITRPALRAAIAAMHWIAPHAQATPVASLDEALQRGHAALAREGITAPRLSAIEFEGC